MRPRFASTRSCEHLLLAVAQMSRWKKRAGSFTSIERRACPSWTRRADAAGQSAYTALGGRRGPSEADLKAGTGSRRGVDGRLSHLGCPDGRRGGRSGGAGVCGVGRLGTAKPARVDEPLRELIHVPSRAWAPRLEGAIQREGRARQRPSVGTVFSSRVSPSTLRAGRRASTGETSSRLALAAGRELAGPLGGRFELRGKADNAPTSQESVPSRSGPTGRTGRRTEGRRRRSLEDPPDAPRPCTSVLS